MKIRSGIHGGRKLNTPKNNTIRPTSDKIRQAIFNSLQSRGVVENAIILDAFCGTGALGLEALSQGAAQAYFFDKNKTSLDLCKQNIALLKEEDRSICMFQDATKVKRRSDDFKKVTLAFLDPPYSKNLMLLTIEALIQNDWLEDDCFFVLEAQKNEVVETAHIEIQDQKIYGDTAIFFAQRNL